MKEQPPTWDDLYATVSNDIMNWRQKNKKATFTEIEESIDNKLARLRAQMLEDVINASEMADVRAIKQKARPKCPQCDEAVQANGQQTRFVKTDYEQTVKVERSQVRCHSCGYSFFPSGQ